MRSPFLLVGMAILATGLVVLLLFGGDGEVGGLPADGIGRMVSLTAVLVLVSAGLVAGRHRANARLWHVAVWLALLFALVLGYQLYQDMTAPPPPVGITAASV